jgi:5-methyltetrahydropteroyltriglutamate--homocysteine methyltransferase
MTAPAALPYRADHVGSLLRPPRLLEAREQCAQGKIDRVALRGIEDSAITEAVRMQESVGLRTATDGEFRRAYFHVDFLEQLSGITTSGGMSVSFHTRAGEVDFQPPVMRVTGPVRHVKSIQGADYKFLANTTRQTPKVCMPSPTMLHFRGGRAAVSQEVYPDLDQFFADVATAYQEELKSLAALGCNYVQLDDTNLAYLCDEHMRQGARERGDDPAELPRRYARLINEAIKERPEGMVVAVHLCRGNFRSAWAAEGGYEPVAEVLFNELDVDAYFLEYDDERSGDFSPLRFVPAGKRVVLGLISTKVPELESQDALRRRIDEAARYVEMGQLCLSPQCGFSSTYHGNAITPEVQSAKLRLVVDTARAVWPDA